MLTGRSFPEKIGQTVLLLFLLLCSRVAWADAILDSDTTAPSTTTNLQDTVNFVIFDYSTTSFLGAQPMPIDRPFNIKVINIPSDTVVDKLSILQIEPRSRRTKYKFHNGDLVTQAELDTLVVIREIRCSGSSLKIRPNEAIFVVPHNLIPNRNYVVSFGGHSTTKISAAEQAALRGKFTFILRHDPYFTKFIRKEFNDRFFNPAHSYKPLKLSQDTLEEHLKRIVQQQYPQYTLLLPDSKTDTTQYYYNFIDGIVNLRSSMASLQKCIGSSGKGVDKFPAVQNKLKDTTGALDTVLMGVKQSLKGLDVPDSCPVFVQLTGSAIDAITMNLDSFVYKTTDSVIVTHLFNLGSVASTYYVDLVKNAQRNVTLDLGGGYSWGMDQFFGYFAADIYLRSIDKNLPLWNTNYGFWDYLGSHMCFVAGLTLTSVAKAKVRSGIAGSDGLVLGAGFRFLPWFKLNAGTLVYNRLNPDPLVSTGAKTHFGLFLSTSIDLDVKGIFSSIPLINQIVLK